MNRKIYAFLTLAILVLSASPLLSMNALAIPVLPSPVPAGYPVNWVTPDGELVAASLAKNPEYLKVRTNTHVSHDTRIHIMGEDSYGQPIEGYAVNMWHNGLALKWDVNNPATWCIPASTPSEMFFPVVNPHSGKEVTFSKITAIIQQGGEHSNSFKIETLPEPYWIKGTPATPIIYEEYLGVFHYKQPPPWQPTYVEPSNPDPVKILLNWVDMNSDGVPDKNDLFSPAQEDTNLLIKGLDEKGNVQDVQVAIAKGEGGNFANPIIVPGIWSDISLVKGLGPVQIGGDSYYFFTHPEKQREIFIYELSIHHITVSVKPKNILADGGSDAKGTATITITLRDIDNEPIHWTTASTSVIWVNVFASGGKVNPSIMSFKGCEFQITTKLKSDTNARSIKITALVIVPAFPPNHPLEVQLWGQTFITFDGVNSNKVGPKITPIGGPGSGTYYEVYIPLNPGCNLISIPVFADDEYAPQLMASDLVKTSANTLLHTIAYFDCTSTWHFYDFVTQTGEDFPLVPGWGYWIKAQKPCTLVVSGKFYDQAPFVPPEHHVHKSWNLMGVTSLQPLQVKEYLKSLTVATGIDGIPTIRGYGPVWTYVSETQTWYRLGDDDWLWPTWGFWVVTIGPWIGP